MSVIKQLCGPCLYESIPKEGAVYCRDCQEPLCDKCKHDHGRIKVSKHHKLCELSDLPPPDIQDLLKSLTACPNHQKEEVVFLCKDHDVTCCNKCAMADHRKCEEVKVISDILHIMKTDCSGLKTTLREMRQQGASLLEHERKHELELAETERKAMSLLQDIKRKLLETYSKIEQEVVALIADKKKVIFEKMGAQRQSVTQILSDIEHQSYYIDHVEKFGTEDHVALVQRKIDQETRPRLQSAVVDLKKRRTMRSFKCTINTCLDFLLTEIRNALRIEDVSEIGLHSAINQTVSFVSTEQSILDLQSEEICEMQLIDNNDTTPDSCIWIDHQIVISLSRVPSIVVFHEHNKTVLSKFNCQSTPSSISKTGSSDIVFSMPLQRKIAFAQLRHGNVHILAEMKTRVPYRNVARDTALNQYICLSSDEGQIDVLNNDGTLVRSLTLSSEIISCIKSSLYFTVHVNRRQLFLSKQNSNEITAIDLDGKKVYDYKHETLIGPRGCAVDCSGNLYVACPLGNNIQQIGTTGKYIGTLLLDAPCGLCFNETFNKLAIVGGTEKYYLRLYKYFSLNCALS
ncbi:hypothetical protein DPMN_156374 [Dreissena polymorpha]|uniref:B box-type domain-containing protein n=1 Tax=Dreissena polymorpha TaxID=45954 RepID=A0A9D4FU98_DREPO|nr:hypothetical protein DPMN_156374 [Dreissena polymorpha]